MFLAFCMAFLDILEMRVAFLREKWTFCFGQAGVSTFSGERLPVHASLGGRMRMIQSCFSLPVPSKEGRKDF